MAKRRDQDMPEDERRRLGAHYTPRDLASTVVARALEPHFMCRNTFRHLRVCDPAMGDGVFLVEALKRITAEFEIYMGKQFDELYVKRFVADNMLFGVDKDPGAVSAAIDAISTECHEHVNPHHYVCGDALVGPSDNDLPSEDLFGVDWTLGGTVSPFDWRRFPPITCWVGNPPFLGGRKISGTLGKDYQAHLESIHEIGYHGNADLAAHFLRRCAFLTRPIPTTMGFICTNTIAQGDTRHMGLQYLTNFGWTIYDAFRAIKWPGDAKVTVSTVHLYNSPF